MYYLKQFGVVLGLILFCVACKERTNNITTPTSFISSNALAVIKVNDINTYKSDLVNSHFLNTLRETKFYNNLYKPLPLLHFFNEKHSLFIAYQNIKDTLQFIAIGKPSNTYNKDSLTIYNKIQDSLLFISSSKSIINKLNKQPNNTFKNLEKLPSNNTTFSVFLNPKIGLKLQQIMLQPMPLDFNSWTIFDVNITPNELLFNGLAVSKDSLLHFQNLFKQTKPEENKLENIVPSTSYGFKSFTYNSYENIQHNFKELYIKTPDSVLPHYFSETLNEFGYIYLEKDTILATRSIDVAGSKEALDISNLETELFRDVTIYSLTNKIRLPHSFIYEASPKSVCIIDGFILFANSKDPLMQIISQNSNGNTINKLTAYNASKSNLSDEASALYVQDQNLLKLSLTFLLDEDISQIQLEDYKASSIQIIEDDDFIHINSVVKKETKQTVSNTISEQFNISLENDVLMNPHFVTNHRTNQKDIVVQDINNVLYLISNRGKILWKKKLQGPILGDINQVDLYKNGHLQLVFATPKRLYIIDRNGNLVKPFPLKFNDPITQPLSVFDYDNNKNYRFGITQNAAMLMYNSKGKLVKGFTYKPSKTITSKPKHIRYNTKDYIVFTTTNAIKILNRRGTIRVANNERFEQSNNEVYWHKNAFTTTSKKGELVQLDVKGHTSKQPLNLAEDHTIDATSKTLISLSDNILYIRQKRIELEFANYTKPKIFYINDKIYITLTNLQSQEILMFDSQAKPIANFPVYGNSSIEFANIDKDKNLEFVTKGESDSLILYQIN